MFSCAIVLGSIVTRCPSMSLAPSALVQLDSACELFSKAAPGFRAGKVLEIMLRLQAKAHMSLDDYRKGKGSTLGRHITSEPATPVDDEDELSTLGGKTRLVAKKEPQSPQILERSPISQNPVVPLPLQISADSNVNADLVQYLGTFPQDQHQQHHQQQHQRHQSHPSRHMVTTSVSSTSSTTAYQDVDVSMYGLSSIPTTTTTYHQEPTTYNTHAQQQMMQTEQQQQQLSSPILLHHQQTQQQRQQHQQQQQQAGASGSGMPSHAMNGFPQYFPVYDYGTGVVGGDNGYSPVIETSGGPAHLNGTSTRRSSGTPEANMHTTWNDFVAGLAMN